MVFGSFMWKIKAIVYEERNLNGKVVFKRKIMKARKVAQEGGFVFQLSNGKKVMPPKSEILPLNDKIIYLGSKQQGDYFFLREQKPLEFKFELKELEDGAKIIYPEKRESEFEPIPQNQKILYINERKMIDERKRRMEGLLSKVLPIVVVLVIAIGAMLIIKSTLDGIQPIAADMKATADSMKIVAEAMAKLAANASAIDLPQGW